jgi:hypothetical protein
MATEILDKVLSSVSDANKQLFSSQRFVMMGEVGLSERQDVEPVEKDFRSATMIACPAHRAYGREPHGRK